MSQLPESPAPSHEAGAWRGADGRVRAIWRCLMFSLISIGPVLLLQNMGDGRGGLPSEAPLLGGTIVAYLVFNGVLLLLSWGFLAWFDGQGFCSMGFCFYRGWGKETLVGVGVGGALILAVTGVLLAGGAVKFSGWGLAQGEMLRFVLLGLVLVVAAAFEEFLTRGYAFQRLVEATGAPVAILVFSTLFGAGHLWNPGATFLSTISTVVAGILLSVAYLKTRGLWLPIGLHWIWNFMMGPILGFPVSGLVVAPTIVKTQIGGATWFSGGNYGPEGGLVVGVVAGLATVWVWRTAKIKPSPAMARALE